MMLSADFVGSLNPILLQRWWLSCFDIADSQASPSVRRFRTTTPAKGEVLETVGKTFLRGYRAGLLASDGANVTASISDLPLHLQGFAAEGAAMGTAIADGVLPGRRLTAWIEASAERFSYLSHVGAGWAVARLPHRKRAILASLDPVHFWLAFDGLGFHDAYFAPHRILAGWRRSLRGYACRAYAQGVGRGLWFIGGGDVAWIADHIDRAPLAADLWSGLGLAVAYAGGADDLELRLLRLRAGRRRGDLAQGAVFAAAAHKRAGAAPEHTAAALRIIAEIDLDSAARLAAGSRLDLPEAASETPAYEVWRQRVRHVVSEHGLREAVA